MSRFSRRVLLRAGGTVGAAAATGCARVPRRPQTASPIIDVHTHAGMGKHYGKPIGEQYKHWTVFNDYNDVLRSMALAGIARSVVFPINNDAYLRANEEIALIASSNPEKLVGFAKHDQKNEAGQIRHLLTREVRELGLKGLKLHGVPTDEMLEVVAELGIPILFHPRRVAEIYPSVERAPSVRFILAHLGSHQSKSPQDHQAAVEAVRRYPNLYMETSSVTQPEFLERAVRTLPQDKLMFGSDAVGPAVKQQLESILALRLSPEHESAILGNNARRVIGI